MQGEVNAQGQRRCTCSKRCRGEKWVSYKTYLSHAQYRDADKDTHFATFVSQFGTDNPTRTRTRQKVHSGPRTQSTTCFGLSPRPPRTEINASGSPELSQGLGAPSQPPLSDLTPHPSGPPPGGCNTPGSSEDLSRDFGAPSEAPLSDLDAPNRSQSQPRDFNSPGTLPLNNILGNGAAGSLPDIGDRGIWQYGPHGDQSHEDEAGEGEQGTIDDEMDLDEGNHNPLPPEDSDNENFHSKFTDCPRSSHIKLEEFIASIRNAQFSDDMDPEMISALKNPSRAPPDIDETTRMSIDIYLGLSNASEQSYENTRKALARRNPPVEIHSLHIVKKNICDMTGVKTIETDMCINSCLAYTGPFSSLQACTQCGEPRYEDSTSQKRVARQRFCTIPLGPQLQAMYRSPGGADRMHYCARKTRAILEQLVKDNDEIPVYEDVYHGEDYLEAVRRGDISENDIVCMFSLDGAQLYRDKASDCWFFIWINLNLPPELRYKKMFIIPTGFVPGPNKPIIIESFLLPSFRHFSALQKNGLRIWDGRRQEEYTAHPYWLFGTADTPGLTTLSGLVGHGGRLGCRLFCGFPGRRKGSKYYPAALKPINYNVANSSHPDVDVDHLPSPSRSKYAQAIYTLLTATDTNYERLRLATGATRPSIVLGLQPGRTLSVPRCFTPDMMHLACLNIPQHLLQIWRNSVKPRLPNNCPFIVLQSDEAWAMHGALVASARPYLPSSFNRPPRNPAEKVNSGYKAWEFTIYFYVLGPAVFRLVLPDYLWTHFCQLVRGIRIVFQRRIMREQVNKAHEMLVKWSKEFEEYYYQRNEALLYLVRPSTHAVLHLALETVRCGPLNLVAQWALENTVGNLGREVHQHSNPFANLSQRGLLRAQRNALMSMIPGLSDDKPFPPISRSLSDGFVLLHAREKTYGSVTPTERIAILRYLSKCRLLSLTPRNFEVTIRKWARLRLPNGQKARCAWKDEAKQKKQNFRNSRNIKFIDESSKKTYYAEVLYYFQVLVNDVEIPAAMTCPYTNPDPGLVKKSHGTLYVCQPRENVLNVINVKTIQSVVAMIPFPLRGEEAVQESYQNFFYVGEKPFFELTIEGYDGNDSDDEDTD